MEDRSTNAWLKFLFGPWLWIIGFFYRSYTANRDRVARLMAKPWVSASFKILVVLTFVAWILIWMFASEESRTRLTDEVTEHLRGLESSSDR